MSCSLGNLSRAAWNKINNSPLPRLFSNDLVTADLTTLEIRANKNVSNESIREKTSKCRMISHHINTDSNSAVVFFPSEVRFNVLYSFFCVDSGEENPQESKV